MCNCDILRKITPLHPPVRTHRLNYCSPTRFLFLSTMSRYFFTPSGLPAPQQVVIGPYVISTAPSVVHAPVPIPIPVPAPMAFHPLAFVAPPAFVTSPSHSHSSRVDSVAVAIITRGRSGRRQILMVHTGSRASIETVSLLGRDPHALLAQLLSQYGLTHFGKKTYIEHVDHATRERTLCCVVYAPELSRHRINTAFARHQPSIPPLSRFLIGTHTRHTIQTDSGSTLAVSDWVYHFVHAIDQLWSSLA